MRTQGTVTKWNDERGFGFILSESNNGEIFVHISAFPDRAIRPKVGERVVFEIERSDDGKQRAVRIARPDIPHSSTRLNQKGIIHFIRQIVSGAIVVAITASAVMYGYPLLINQQITKMTVQDSDAHVPSPAPVADIQRHFKCDGRIHCSQMTSLEEAEYFLRHCPDTKMDGDGDGHPCERQFGY